MHRHLTRTLVSSALAVVPVFAQGSRIEASLSQPVPAIEPNARGRIELEQDSSGPGEKINLKIQRISAVGSSYELWLEEPLDSGTFVHVGAFDADPRHSDRAEYERRTDQGETLPLGVANLEALKDRLLEVRNAAGEAILIGSVPDIGSGQTGSGRGAKAKGEAPLLRPSPAPLPSAQGTVQAERHGDEHELEIETEDFDVTSEVFSVWLADAQSVMVDIGVLASDRGRSDHGRAEWRQPGNGLPLQATTIDELGGRRVEIRNAADVVVLLGEIPTVGQAASNQRSNQRLVAEPAGATINAKGFAKTSWQPARGRFRLDVRAMATDPQSDAELWLINPGTGLFELVDTKAWTGGRTRNVRFRWDSTRSQALPFGVTDPSVLLGTGLEVRLVSGEVILSGNL